MKDYRTMSFEEYKYSFIIVKSNGAKHLSTYLRELKKRNFDILIDAIVGNNVRKESKGMEYLDIYDKDKNLTGKKIERYQSRDDLKDGEYFLFEQAWIIDSNNQILLTRRAPNKKYGGIWEPTSGHVQSGETSLDGIKRELEEELGLEVEEDVRAKKGKSRPIMNQFQRAYMVDNLKSVDFTIIADKKEQTAFISSLISEKQYNQKEIDKVLRDGYLIEKLNPDMIFTKWVDGNMLIYSYNDADRGIIDEKNIYLRNILFYLIR